MLRLPCSAARQLRVPRTKGLSSILSSTGTTSRRSRNTEWADGTSYSTSLTHLCPAMPRCLKTNDSEVGRFLQIDCCLASFSSVPGSVLRGQDHNMEKVYDKRKSSTLKSISNDHCKQPKYREKGLEVGKWLLTLLMENVAPAIVAWLIEESKRLLPNMH